MIRNDEIVVDLFAGGGGASVGIEAAMGRRVDVAVNHDPIAIACHQANHPKTRHYLTSVFDVDPIEASDGRPVGLLWASPDCTHFSRAKGNVPRSQGIRSLAWVVTDWAKAVSPRMIVLENVPEFEGWGPLAEDGRPDPLRRGETFGEFVGSLRALGYDVGWRVLVACDYGAPTKRLRLFLVARRDGEPIAWPEKTHGPGREHPYHTAAECIDWSIPCPSIFLTPAEVKDQGLKCRRPLAEKTMARIAEGVRRYVIEAGDDAFLEHTAHGDVSANGKRRWGKGSHPNTEPVPTVTGSNDFAVVCPTIIQIGYGERPATPGRKGQAPRVPGLHKPLGTVVSGGRKHALVAATMVSQKHGQSPASSCDSPARAVCAQGTHASLIAASIVRQNHGDTPAAAADAPLGVVTSQVNRHTLVSALITKHFGGVVGHEMGRPIGTVTGTDHHSVTTATLSGGGEGDRDEQVRAFLIKYYGCGVGQRINKPIDTITSQDRFGLVTVRGVEYRIVDIGMRMLEPHELLRAQFGRFAEGDGGFTLDVSKRNKSGVKVPITKADRVRLIGNSVPPEMAEALLRANVACELAMGGVA